MSHPLDIPLSTAHDNDLVMDTGGPYDTWSLPGPHGHTYEVEASPSYSAWVINAMPFFKAIVEYQGAKPKVKVNGGPESHKRRFGWVEPRLYELTYEHGGCVQRPKCIPNEYRASWCSKHKMWELHRPEFTLIIKPKWQKIKWIRHKLIDEKYWPELSSLIDFAGFEAGEFLRRKHAPPHRLPDYDPDNHPCTGTRG